MSSREIFLARQPIFDRRLSVYGYEILSRSGPINAFVHPDQDQASTEVIGHSLLVHQLGGLTRNRKAFFNITECLIGEDFLRLLPREQTVIELVESIEPLPRVIASCKRLKEAGYRIALDDFEPRPELEPLLDLADIVKIDFQATPEERRGPVLERCSRDGVEMLAEKVETRAEFRQALELGYTLFQGFFFCQPTVLVRRDLPRGQQSYLRLIHEVSRPTLRLQEIEEIIRGDLSLTVKLLRFLNSASFGVRSAITSIHHAVVYLGERDLRRWGALVALSGFAGDHPSELVVTSLVRARFCERIGELTGSDADRAFLIGLFSLLGVLVQQPLAEVLAEVAVGPEIESAIHGDETVLGRIFALSLAYEQGHWEQALELSSALGLDSERLAGAYGESVAWAHALSEGAGRIAA